MMNNRKKYSWNPAFNYIMKIKDAYVARFGKCDTYSIETMAMKLGTEELKNFVRCVEFHVNGSLNGLKYSLIKGGKSDLYDNPDSVLREMRGLVINMETEEIVVCPFRKFFNINEIEETSLKEVSKKINEADLVELTNKMDGSMISVRYYNGKFFLAGTGCIDEKISFRLQEADSWLTPAHKSMMMSNPSKTFIFEYISWKDKHVVEYPKDAQNIYLIGIRDVFTGHQASYKELSALAKQFDVPITEFEGDNLAKCLGERENFKSYEKEGWVLYLHTKDGTFMYKLKCDDYVNVHRVLDGLTSQNIVIEQIAKGNFDDLLAKLPDVYHERILSTFDMVQKFLKLKTDEIEDAYDKVKDITEQKDFALAVKSEIPKHLVAYMFMKRRGQSINLLEPKQGHFPKYREIEDYLAEHE